VWNGSSSAQRNVLESVTVARRRRIIWSITKPKARQSRSSQLTIAVMQDHLGLGVGVFIQVLKSSGVEGGRSSDDSVNNVTLGKEQLCEVGSESVTHIKGKRAA